MKIQVIFNWFSCFILLLRFKHVTNNSSKPIFHSELKDEISPLYTLPAKLEILFLLSLSDICICWKCCSAFSVFLLFLFFTNFWNFFSIRAFTSLLLFPLFVKGFLFFYLCYFTIACRPLQLSVEWLHFPTIM